MPIATRGFCRWALYAAGHVALWPLWAAFCCLGPADRRLVAADLRADARAAARWLGLGE